MKSGDSWVSTTGTIDTDSTLTLDEKGKGYF